MDLRSAGREEPGEDVSLSQNQPQVKEVLRKVLKHKPIQMPLDSPCLSDSAT